jgi:hypothetical protein
MLPQADVKGGGVFILIPGAGERMAGKITGDPGMQARGRERQVNHQL